jgi:hypothetical protein
MPPLGTVVRNCGIEQNRHPTRKEPLGIGQCWFEALVSPDRHLPASGWTITHVFLDSRDPHEIGWAGLRVHYVCCPDSASELEAAGRAAQAAFADEFFVDGAMVCWELSGGENASSAKTKSEFLQ